MVGEGHGTGAERRRKPIGESGAWGLVPRARAEQQRSNTEKPQRRKTRLKWARRRADLRHSAEG